MDPSGSFFTHFCITTRKEHSRKVDITILDGRDFIQKGPVGCNMCAGVLSETLTNKMECEGIVLPKTRVQQGNRWLLFTNTGTRHPITPSKTWTQAKNHNGIPRKRPRFSELTTNISFDDFLLKHVASQGAKVLPAIVEEIDLPKDPQDLVNIVYKEADVRKRCPPILSWGIWT